MKSNSIYSFLFLLLLYNCKKIETNKEFNNSNKIDNVHKDSPKKIDYSKFNNLKFYEKKLPIIDSTNFDNFKELKPLSKEIIEELQLRKINSDADNFFANYKINFSENFQSFVIVTKSEVEMKTFLVNYNNRNEIIDKLMIAYDEIAESAFHSISKINNKEILIENYNDMDEIPEKQNEKYIIEENGKFLKNDDFKTGK